MCGLFGCYSTHITNTEKDNVILLGILSSTRGLDSTGMVGLGRKNGKQPVIMHKELMNPVSYFETKGAKQVFAGNSLQILMGHARAATLGGVTLENAHPVFEGNIIGCHNGTIHEFAKDPKKDSDSRELFRRVSTRGLQQTLRDADRGAYALSFIDSRTRTLNFVRNKERPLWFMWSKSHTDLYWASEFWMLRAIAIRQGESNFDSPMYAQPGMRYYFQIGNMKMQSETLNLTPAVSVPLLPGPKKERAYPNQQATGRYCRGCYKDELFCVCGEKSVDTSGSGVMAKESKRSHIFDKPAANDDVAMVYRGYDGKIFAPSKIARRLAQGCSTCKATTRLKDRAFWFDEDEFICETCFESDDPLIKDYVLREHKVYEGKIITYKGKTVDTKVH